MVNYCVISKDDKQNVNNLKIINFRMKTEEDLTERKHVIRFIKSPDHTANNANTKQICCVAYKVQSANQSLCQYAKIFLKGQGEKEV